MLESEGGQLFFMGAPAHLGRGRPLLPEALHAPGIDELVHLFGLIGDLRVALAAVNDLDAELLGQVVKVPRLGVVSDPLRLSPAEFLLRQRALRDVEQRVLGEMADQAGVRSVFDHRRRPGLAPRGDHPPQIHVAPVEGSLGRVLVFGSGVGIPELHRRVHIEDAPVVAPLHDFATIDIPRQVDEEVSGREVLSQQAPQVLRRHAILDESHALLDPGLQRGIVWLKVYDGDALGIDAEVFDQNGQRATRHRSKTDEQDSIRKPNHRYSSFLPGVVIDDLQGMTPPCVNRRSDNCHPVTTRKARSAFVTSATPRRMLRVRHGPNFSSVAYHSA